MFSLRIFRAIIVSIVLMSALTYSAVGLSQVPGTIWANSFGDGSLIVNDITVDIYNNTWITGRINGLVDLDPDSIGVFTLNPESNQAAVIAKYDSNGDFVWAGKFDTELPPASTHEQVGTSIESDANGNIYTTGEFYGIVDFDPGIDSVILTANNTDAFIQKLDSSGDFVWVKQLGNQYIDKGQSIVLDDNDNIYTLGTFFGTLEFHSGEESINITAEKAYNNFILKLSPYPLGLSKVDKTGFAKAYPNPTNGRFKIEFDVIEPLVEITILSDDGRICGKSNYSNTKSIDLKIEQPSGVYSIKIETATSSQIIRVLKF
jgi:hypothetical protein